VRKRFSISIDERLLKRIEDIVSDEKSPFYQNRSRLVEYYLRLSLPARADISVER